MTSATKTIREEMISYSPVKLIDEVISRAFQEKSSDIHIEPAEHECRVRIRIDGALVHLGRYKKEIHEEAVARLKVLSMLRTDVRMSPQDGRFKVNISGTGINVRLSIVPSFYGEKCVLRLLPQTTRSNTFEALGFNQSDTKKITDVLGVAHGMILVVGPTGSGKTTTLYALLGTIAQPEVSVVTLEDPIEYSVPGITQIPIHLGNNLTFVTALRAVVRQDPDVIMVGEIRDSVTAELSTQAALTGHLLLSTLHTNDAVTALPRLIDMGVEPFLIASTVRAIISQRLVRKICMKCKVEVKPTASEMDFFKKANTALLTKDQSLFRGKGCLQCRNTGYSGRTVISEVLILNEKVRDLIMQKAQSEDIRKAAVEGGMTVLMEDAIEKVLQGLTTLDEVASACHI